ncbi:MAG: GNAT family N-acetyltransferase, partial [Oscillospiraceae bacterium]
MVVSLTPITKDNYNEVVFLSTNNRTATIKQEYVAVNAISIVKSFFEADLYIRGIVKDKTYVGFCMYGYDNENKIYKVYSLMIDKEHQQHGYGGEALVLMLNEMKKLDGCEKVYITCLENNVEAKELFSDLGFEE